jgi:hypothetical protein
MKKRQIITLAGVLGLSVVAHGALIVYEGFDYTEANGTSIGGLNGGTGWTEAYPNPDGSHVLADGLSFAGVPSTGKAMTRSGGTLTTDGRHWDTTISGTTYWYSFLVNSSGHEGTFGLFQRSLNDNQNGTGIELRREADGSTRILATGSYAVQARIVPAGETHLVVGHISGNNNYLWVYANGEAAPTSAPATGDAATVWGGALTDRMPAMYGRSFGSSQGPVTFDEIRLGTEFTDVIPEPATLGLVGMIGIGLIAVRRFFTI